MQRDIDAFLSARSREQIAASSLALVAFIGASDYLTGYELAFSIFYLVPVGLGTWYAGPRIGISVCLVSAATWLVVDHAMGHQYAHPAIPFWNATVCLGFFVIVAHLLCRLRAALDAQAALAQQDGLTGILNARAFRQRYATLAELAARHRHSIALGYLDIDGFKGVNDSLGHSAGDQVLKAVASALATRLRASDFVGRVGGDEFAILLSETDLAGARTFFTDMRAKLLDVAARNRWPIGFSIGVAVFPSPSTDADAAFRHADALMYRVKRAGKNGLMLEEYVGESGGA